MTKAEMLERYLRTNLPPELWRTYSFVYNTTCWLPYRINQAMDKFEHKS